MDCDRQLSDLVGTIYDAGLGITPWDAVLSAVVPAVGGEVAAMFFNDHAPGRVASEVLALHGYPDTVPDLYRHHFGAVDVRIPAVSRLPSGGVYVDDRTMPFAAVEASEIYNDFYRPMGIGQGMAIAAFNANTRNGLLSVHRAAAQGSFHAAEIALFEQLAPHVARALQVQRQIASASAVAAARSLALAHFATAVLLTNRHGEVLELNPAAEELLRQSHCPLRIAVRLTATMPRDGQALSRALAAAGSSLEGRTTHPPAVLRLRKGDGSGTLGIMLVPVRQGAHLGLSMENLVLAFISDTSQRAPTSSELLSLQFGVSPAEAQVAAQLAQGDSIDDIAASRGVSRETVRVQAKSLLAKTGTRSQGQLVGVVLRSLAALRAASDQR